MKGFKTKIFHFMAAVVLLAVGFGIGFCTYARLDHTEAITDEASYINITVPEKETEQQELNEDVLEYKTYYWVSDGEVYHITKNCPTLARSKDIVSGTVPPSSRCICKVCS